MVVVLVLIGGCFGSVLTIGTLAAYMFTRPPEHWVWGGWDGHKDK